MFSSASTMGAFMAHADLHAKITCSGIRRLTVLQSVLWARWLGTQHRFEGRMGSGQIDVMVSDALYEVGVGGRVAPGSFCSISVRTGMRSLALVEGMYGYHVAVRRLFVYHYS